MSIGPIITVEEFETYQARVLAVRERIEQLGRGAYTRAANECYLTPSRVSNILGCRYYDVKALELLEVWAEEVQKTAVA